MTAIGSAAYVPSVQFAVQSYGAGGGQLSDVELAQVFYEAGFRGEDLVTIVAIAKRESDGVPAAHNDNSRTRDDSYGLTQINVYGENGRWLMEKFGLTSPEQLLDPAVNARVAFGLAYLFDPPFRPWGPYRGESPTFNTDLPEARAAVAEAERQGLLGQPLPDGGASAPGPDPAATATTGTASAAASHPVLRIGARGEDVKDLQRQLVAAGFDPGPVDGWFGPRTQAAVRAFQHSRGIAVDGWVGPQTWGRLDAVGGGGAATGGRLAQGASGPQVAELQQMLQALGYYHGNIGGNFGPQTDAAVRAFQRDRGLTVDGWAGPQTMAALREGPAPEAPGSSAPPAAGTGDASLESALNYGIGQVGLPYRAVAGFRMGEPWQGGPRTDFHNGNSVDYADGSRGYDCSGLVVDVFRQMGIELAYQDSKSMLDHLPAVPREQMRRGDLIVKDGHVAIYLGPGNECLEATRGGGVHVSQNANTYLNGEYEVRRVPR
jgi:peptidoglycan hydrolase-like protein with peptidoglycan-binding domain